MHYVMVALLQASQMAYSSQGFTDKMAAELGPLRATVGTKRDQFEDDVYQCKVIELLMHQ